MAGAAGLPEFLGYKIPKPFRSLLFFLEDDDRGLQDKLKRMIGKDLNLEGRLRVVTRQELMSKGVPIDVRDTSFIAAVDHWIEEHEPDFIVFDNLAHLVGADYNDARTIHQLVTQVFKWAEKSNAAIMIAAHPKKLDQKFRVTLAESGQEAFMESVMGSSHFINSMGCLYAIELDKKTAMQSSWADGSEPMVRKPRCTLNSTETRNGSSAAMTFNGSLKSSRINNNRRTTSFQNGLSTAKGRRR